MKTAQLLLIIFCFFLFSSCDKLPGNGRIFYVDSQSGDDQNSGLKPEKAWASLEKVNQQVFLPGDQILLKSGTTYTGQLEPKGSGSNDAPVVIGCYGGEQKPLIRGLGQKKYALLLENLAYYEVSDLEITNTGKEREAGRSGVLIHAKNCGDLHHIVLNQLDVHDVNGSLVKDEGGGSAIFWRNEGDSIPSRFVDLRIENCYLHDCARNGITSTGNSGRDHWYPSLKVVIRGNVLEGIPGDGIVPIGCDSALVEYNVMRDCPDMLSHQEAAAGIWPWSCDNTLIQYNEVSGHQAKWDGQGFDSDYNCSGTIIRYNYSHDNNGGFLLVCNDGNSLGKNWNHGTKNSLIQFNLSVNDGIRPYPTERSGWFSPVFHITGPAVNTRIDHNVVVVPEKEKAEIPSVMIEVGDWGQAWPKNTIMEKNLFFTNSGPIFHWGNATGTLFQDNVTRGLESSGPGQIAALLTELVQNADPADQDGYTKMKDFVLSRITEK